MNSCPLIPTAVVRENDLSSGKIIVIGISQIYENSSNGRNTIPVLITSKQQIENGLFVCEMQELLEHPGDENIVHRYVEEFFGHWETLEFCWKEGDGLWSH